MSKVADHYCLSQVPLHVWQNLLVDYHKVVFLALPASLEQKWHRRLSLRTKDLKAQTFLHSLNLYVLAIRRPHCVLDNG